MDGSYVVGIQATDYAKGDRDPPIKSSRISRQSAIAIDQTIVLACRMQPEASVGFGEVESNPPFSWLSVLCHNVTNISWNRSGKDSSAGYEKHVEGADPHATVSVAAAMICAAIFMDEGASA